MLCRQISDGPCKTYLLVSAKTKEAVLVDPLLEKAQDYLQMLKNENLRLTHVIDTHTHADHLSAGAVLRDKASVAYLMHQNTRVSRVTQRVQDGETLGVGDIRISFLHTPGHTSDSLTLILQDRILSGDFLFIGSYGAGRLDLPGSDAGVHFDSLKKIEALSDAMLMLPAHDYQGATESTLGAERKINPVLTPRSREKYIQWWSEKKSGPADWMKEVVKANLIGARDPKVVVIPKEGAACACVAGPSHDGEATPQISPKDLALKIRQSPDSVVLLDVRSAEEYSGELGHITGSVLIPIDELSARLAEVPPGPVATICYSGKRASRAASLLRSSGRNEVWVMTGGMLAWSEEHLPVA